LVAGGILFIDHEVSSFDHIESQMGDDVGLGILITEILLIRAILDDLHDLTYDLLGLILEDHATAGNMEALGDSADLLDEDAGAACADANAVLIPSTA